MPERASGSIACFEILGGSGSTPRVLYSKPSTPNNFLGAVKIHFLDTQW